MIEFGQSANAKIGMCASTVVAAASLALMNQPESVNEICCSVDVLYAAHIEAVHKAVHLVT